ncbi:hypothetical protein [Streptomyces sp. NPDC059224]
MVSPGAPPSGIRTLAVNEARIAEQAVTSLGAVAYPRVAAAACADGRFRR